MVTYFPAPCLSPASPARPLLARPLCPASLHGCNEHHHYHQRQPCGPCARRLAGRRCVRRTRRRDPRGPRGWLPQVRLARCQSSQLLTRSPRGHGTLLVDGVLRATTCGTVQRVNKLVAVRPLKSRCAQSAQLRGDAGDVSRSYTAETGDVVVGRVTEARRRPGGTGWE